MYIIATFFGDYTFTHLINTNNLSKELKEDVESKVQNNSFSTFSGHEYFCKLQDGAVFSKLGESIFPVEIVGMIEIYLD